MKISTKGRYGLRALLDLAIHSSDGQVPLSAIAERQNISFNYLEQVFATLRKGGIVRSVKGPQGGYILGDKIENIKIIDVIKVLEGEYNIADEEDENKVNQQAINNLLWKKINISVNNIFSSTTLEDLVNEYNRLDNTVYDMYYI